MIILAMALLASPHRSAASGFASTIAIFQSDVHPDLPFGSFAAGLGIIQPTWRSTFLVVAYRYLAGPTLGAREQQALVSYWNAALRVDLTEPESQLIDDSGGESDNRIVIKNGGALMEWLAARNKIPGVATADAIETIRMYRSPTGQMLGYANCNYSAFQTAAQSLATMSAKFGPSSPQIQQWLGASGLR